MLRRKSLRWDWLDKDWQVQTVLACLRSITLSCGYISWVPWTCEWTEGNASFWRERKGILPVPHFWVYCIFKILVMTDRIYHDICLIQLFHVISDLLLQSWARNLTEISFPKRRMLALQLRHSFELVYIFICWFLLLLEMHATSRRLGIDVF